MALLGWHFRQETHHCGLSKFDQVSDRYCSLSGNCIQTRRSSRPRRTAAFRVQNSLPQHLQAARAKKQAGLVLFGGITVASLAFGSATDLPNIRPVAAVLLVGSGIIAALLNGIGGLRLQVINGAIYVQWGEDIPTDGPQLASGAVEVRTTGDTRGNGAFATQLIKKDTFLGPYEGEMLDEAQYWDRYPSGMSDYAICIDAEMTLDARERVKDTSSFSPCHINHSSTRNNVVRQPLREQQAIHFYAKRDIQAGEELLLDYGRMYWKGREDKELD